MRVVVAMDGDRAAENALAIVSAWVREYAGEVLLLRVAEPGRARGVFDPEGHDPKPAPWGTVYGSTAAPVRQPPPRARETHGEAVQDVDTEDEDYLRAQAARLLEGCQASHHVVWAEHPADAIAAFAAERGADLVVVGSHNRGALKHVLLGSVAEHVVRTSPVPVLVVRDGMAMGGGGRKA